MQDMQAICFDKMVTVANVSGNYERIRESFEFARSPYIIDYFLNLIVENLAASHMIKPSRLGFISFCFSRGFEQLSGPCAATP